MSIIEVYVWIEGGISCNNHHISIMALRSHTIAASATTTAVTATPASHTLVSSKKARYQTRTWLRHTYRYPDTLHLCRFCRCRWSGKPDCEYAGYRTDSDSNTGSDRCRNFNAALFRSRFAYTDSANFTEAHTHTNCSASQTHTNTNARHNQANANTETETYGSGRQSLGLQLFARQLD